MERLPLLWAEESAGTLSWEREGLYVRLCVRCTRSETGLWYGWVVGERGEIRLGVLEPADGGLVLNRRLSHRELEPLGALIRGEVRSASDTVPCAWEPLRGGTLQTPYLREQLHGKSGVLFRTERGLRVLAIPYSAKLPFPVPAMFCLTRVEQIGGKPYVILTLNPAEEPVLMPEKPLPRDTKKG